MTYKTLSRAEEVAYDNGWEYAVKGYTRAEAVAQYGEAGGRGFDAFYASQFGAEV